MDATIAKMKDMFSQSWQSFKSRHLSQAPTAHDVHSITEATATTAEAQDPSVTPTPTVSQEASPVVRGASDILRGRVWCSLWVDLPKRVQYKEARPVFRSAEDGCRCVSDGLCQRSIWQLIFPLKRVLVMLHFQCALVMIGVFNCCRLNRMKMLSTFKSTVCQMPSIVRNRMSELKRNLHIHSSV